MGFYFVNSVQLVWQCHSLWKYTLSHSFRCARSGQHLFKFDVCWDGVIFKSNGELCGLYCLCVVQMCGFADGLLFWIYSSIVGYFWLTDWGAAVFELCYEVSLYGCFLSFWMLNWSIFILTLLGVGLLRGSECSSTSIAVALVNIWSQFIPMAFWLYLHWGDHFWRYFLLTDFIWYIFYRNWQLFEHFVEI